MSGGLGPVEFPNFSCDSTGGCTTVVHYLRLVFGGEPFDSMAFCQPSFYSTLSERSECDIMEQAIVRCESDTCSFKNLYRA